jgi:NAD(P)-dependent dehydrogenase (short-subunit alcohol dehydrogenase family)
MTIPGKNVLVIGAASGIGRSLVLQLAASYNVIAADCNAEKLSELSASIPETDCFKPLTMDMTSADSVANGLEQVKAEANLLDCVVITAAVHSMHPVEYLRDEDVDKVLEVNLISHIKLIRSVLPLMKDGGRIIGISSVSACLGIPMSSVYSASKAGLETFYEALALEVSYRGIKPIIIQMGNTNTGFNEKGHTYVSQGNEDIDSGYLRVAEATDSSKGISPEVVSKAVHKAMTSKYPQFCYLVGMNTMKANMAKWVLGRTFALKVMSLYFGFPVSGPRNSN